MPGSKIVEVFTLNSEVEAVLMEGALKEKGIPFVISRFNDPGLTAFFHDREDWGVIEAPEEFADVIKKIVNELVAR